MNRQTNGQKCTNRIKALGRVHTDTSTSTSTHLQVPVNTILHAFQWQLFTFIRVRVTCEVNGTQITLI